MAVLLQWPLAVGLAPRENAHTLGVDSPSSSSFTLYSHPVSLRYGQVHNYIFQALTLPHTAFPLPTDIVERYNGTGRDMAISGVNFDFVRCENAEPQDAGGMTPPFSNASLESCVSESSVPLYELYDHHHTVMLYPGGSGPALSLGASFEFRGIESATQHPYRQILHNPTRWYPMMHLIGTKHPTQPFTGGASPLVECPCTERDVNFTNHSIDRDPCDEPVCQEELQGNPACSLETYVGGIMCCELPGMFIDTTECATPSCDDLPLDTVVLKTTIHFEDVADDTREVINLACCDLPSHDNGTFTVEFDVAECEPGTETADCVRTFETVVEMRWAGRGADQAFEGTTHVELAYALPHLHEGGLSIELQDALTNQTILLANRANGGVVYGTGTTPGNERGYITGFRETTWNVADAPVYEFGHPMRLIAIYNATTYTSGAMARVLLAGHPTNRTDLTR